MLSRTPLALFFAASAVFLLTAPTGEATAGPIFQIVSQGSTLPHPSGLGTRAASSSWGISSTGGGFLDAEIVFNNAFVLPDPGSSSAFDETDLSSVRYRHTESAFSVGSPVTPSFLVEAVGGEIASAVGQVVGGGTAENPTWTINFLNQSSGDPNPPIITHVELTMFVLYCCGAGGVFTGNFAIDGRSFILHDALRPGDVTRTDIPLQVLSTNDGQWVLTSVPEPARVGLWVGALMTLAGVARRRDSGRDASALGREGHGRS